MAKNMLCVCTHTRLRHMGGATPDPGYCLEADCPCGRFSLPTSSPEPTEERRPTSDSVAGRRVRHYKGGIYTVIRQATHTETQESLIVYQSSDGRLWARPLAMFLGTVEVDGKVVPRFSFLAAEGISRSPAEVALMQEDLDQSVQSSTDTGESRSRAGSSGREIPAQPTTPGAPPAMTSGLCQRKATSDGPDSLGEGANDGSPRLRRADGVLDTYTGRRSEGETQADFIERHGHGAW